MTDHIRDLDEVVRQITDADAMSYGSHRALAWSESKTAAYDFIRQHHDAIKRNAEDATMWRALCTDCDSGNEIPINIVTDAIHLGSAVLTIHYAKT